MKSLLISFAVLIAAGPSSALASPTGEAGTNHTPALIQLAGNTSSNSSSNTSSNSSARGSSYIHSHNWSVESGDGYRRRSVRGTTYIERYRPPERYRGQRRDWRDDDD